MWPLLTEANILCLKKVQEIKPNLTHFQKAKETLKSGKYLRLQDDKLFVFILGTLENKDWNIHHGQTFICSGSMAISL